MRCAYNSLKIIATSFLLLGLIGCGPSLDYRGPVTLIVTGRSAYRELVISMNGNESLPVGELERPDEKKFTFENAKNGKNHMVLRVVFRDGEIKEKPFSFSALPGAVIKVVVNVRWSFGATIDADVITLAEGVDPAVVAAAAAAQERAEAAERERQEEARLANEREIAKLDEELRKFAIGFIPNLQQTLDKHVEQIKLFTKQRADFAKDMARQGIDPEKRPAYRLKGELIEQMKLDIVKLLERRRETYIRWKELTLLGDSAESKRQLDTLLQRAQDEAKSAEESFEKAMKNSQNPAGQ